MDNIKHMNICLIGVPEGEEREKRGVENEFDEVMAENFPKLKKGTDFQVQESKRVPDEMNPRGPSQDIS